MRFRRLFALLALIIVTCTGQANGTTPVSVVAIATPKDYFFGSVSFVLQTDAKWKCDLKNGYFIEVIPWNTKATPDYWTPSVEYRLYSVGDANEISKTVVNVKDGRTALKISQNNGKINIFANGGMPLFREHTINIDPLKPNTEIEVMAKPDAKVLKAVNRLYAYDLAHYRSQEPQQITDTESDIVTGRWIYLDRSTPSDGSVLAGGRYELDIVADPETPNRYLILFEGGASDNLTLWTKDDVKGVLERTPFENHFDLEWYDSKGRTVTPGECSATLEQESILVLNFPLLKSQLRFRRPIDD